MTELDLVMNNIYIVSSKCCPNYIAKWCSQNSDGEKARGEGVGRTCLGRAGKGALQAAWQVNQRQGWARKPRPPQLMGSQPRPAEERKGLGT